VPSSSGRSGVFHIHIGIDWICMARDATSYTVSAKAASESSHGLTAVDKYPIFCLRNGRLAASLYIGLRTETDVELKVDVSLEKNVE
jgi:hypothetical protein